MCLAAAAAQVLDGHGPRGAHAEAAGGAPAAEVPVFGQHVGLEGAVRPPHPIRPTLAALRRNRPRTFPAAPVAAYINLGAGPYPLASQITTEIKNSATPPRMSTPKNINEFATAMTVLPGLESMLENRSYRKAIG